MGISHRLVSASWGARVPEIDVPWGKLRRWRCSIQQLLYLLNYRRTILLPTFHLLSTTGTTGRSTFIIQLEVKGLESEQDGREKPRRSETLLAAAARRTYLSRLLLD